MEIMFWGFSSFKAGWLQMADRWMWLRLMKWMLVLGWSFTRWRTYKEMCIRVMFFMQRNLRSTKNEAAWRVQLMAVGTGMELVLASTGPDLISAQGKDWKTGARGTTVLLKWMRWTTMTMTGLLMRTATMATRGGIAYVMTDWKTEWVRRKFGWETTMKCTRGARWTWTGIPLTEMWKIKGRQDPGPPT